MKTSRLRERWRSGSGAVGGWCTTGSPLAAELLADAGFDYVCADCQHGLLGYDALVPVLQAIGRTAAAPIVRVPWNGPGDIAKALDARAEAEAAAAACRYPPLGLRSYGPVRSGLFLGSDPTEVNAEVACLVMIETVQAVERADEICTTPGVDGIYIGPADLAVSMGLSPSFSVPSREHADAIEEVRLACRRAGIIAGIHTSGGEQTAERLAQGFDMATVATDAALLRGAAVAGLATARGVAGGGASGGGYI